MIDQPFCSIPPEIQDCIIDELGAMLPTDRRNARSALLSCHRASRSLRPRTLRYLYKDTLFSNADLLPSARSIKPISTLKDIIVSPTGSLGSVGLYIDRVFANFQSTPNRSQVRNPPSNVNHVMNELVTFLGDEDVTSILQALCKQEYGVKDFVLSLEIVPESGCAFRILDYANLPSDFRLAFTSFARSPHLRFLQIQREEPFRYLVARHLRNSPAVNIQGASQNDDYDEANDYSIEMCTDYGFPYGDMLPEPFYRRLSSLIAYNSGREHSVQTWKTVDFASGSLCSLSIFQYGGMEMPPQSFDISQLRKLESFTFLHAFSANYRSGIIGYPDGPNNQTFSMLHQLFNITSVSATPIKSLTNVDLRFEFDDTIPGYPFFARMDPWWEILDHSLCSPVGFPALQRVRLKITVSVVPIDGSSFDKKLYVENTIQQLKYRFGGISARPGISLLVDVVPML